MKRIVILLLTILSIPKLVGQTHQTSMQYIFDVISKDSGFTYSNIRSIVTDKNNMMWFCCDNGLYYYDNNRFIQYRHNANDQGSIPSNDVTTIYYDSNNTLWVVTNKGLCYYDSVNDSFVRLDINLQDDQAPAHFLEYAPLKYITTVNGKLISFEWNNFNEAKQVEQGNMIRPISCLYKGDNGKIYIGCEGGKLYTADDKLSKFELRYSGAESHITSICQSYDKLYVGYANSGIDAIDRQQSIITRYREKAHDTSCRIPSNYVKAINKQLNGDIWVGTGAGIAIISSSSTEIIKASLHNNLSRNSVYSIHVDKHDAVWIGTWAGNIAYYNSANYRFKSNFNSNSMLSDPGHGMVYHFAPHDDKTTWVAGEWTGLGLHDHTENKFIKHYGHNLHIKSLKKDRDGNLWIGTIQQGLYFFDNNSKEITKVPIESINTSNLILSSIAIDEDNNTIWIGSRTQGLIAYNRETKKSSIINSSNTKNFVSDGVWSLEITKNQLLICSDNGFSILSLNGKVENFPFEDHEIPNNIAFSTCQIGKSDNIYIGTKEHGVQMFNLSTRQFIDLKVNNTLKSHTIYNTVIDNKGRLWLSTNNGIYRYNIESEALKHFTKTDGLNSLQFHPASCLIDSSNTLYFGTTTGFNFINTDRIREDKTAPQTYISDIRINNAKLDRSNCRYIDSKHYANASRIALSHKNNSITLLLASNNTLKSDKRQFKYRLKGYQDEWITSSSNSITFTKLPFGKYELEMASCNSDEVWGDSNTISIRIYAPLYLTWYAILLYIVIALLTCVYFMRQAAFKIKAKKDIEFERQINIINNKSFDEKVKFFMNISHELRTPLSLIKAPLSILEREVSSQESQIHINTIKRNTEQLLKLTNQILDFRLLEVGKLSATISKFDLVKLCDEILELFEYHIKDKQINFTFEKSNESMLVLLDRDMISRIIYNLITNALKYTEDGASITLCIANKNISEGDTESDISKGAKVIGSAIVISVEDTGCGIKKDQMQHIFERFYFNTNEAFSSSGIGLHMCMEYANLHQGNISVKSQEGEGSKFTITLPTTCAPAKDAELIKSTPYINKTSQEADEATQSTKDQHKSTVLIVDDNAEIRFYLKKILGRSYNCLTAKNGQQGYELALDIKPDIIILDVLMPMMGGVECAQKLRKEEITKYIPIIMLTGLTDDNKIIQGVKAGADAYISKPINETLLFTHIERLISRYIEIKETKKEVKPNVITTNSNDNFVQKIEAIMEEHVQNSALDVNLIAELMLISRSTLHRNFKREMNMGVAEYIRDYRLRSAVKFMENGVYNIDELSVCAGFNSSSYFCKAFKDKYGVSPKKYYDSLNKQ